MTFEPGPLQYEICADKSGVVTMIDNYLIAKLASLAGAPIDKGAGVDLVKKLGDQVEKGEPLYRVHAEFRSDFKFAQDLSGKNNGYSIGKPEEVSKHFLEL